MLRLVETSVAAEDGSRVAVVVILGYVSVNVILK